jgi:hypothetical protein
MYQLNNSVIFCGKLIGFVEFFDQILEALDIIIDRRLKGSPRKMES